jgi:hypothetical protein
MGDKLEASAGVTAGELAAVLQAMDEKYRSLFDVLSRQGGSLRSEVETKEEIHPLQMPNVKLEGAESYASWAEHAETILVSRKLEGYILGTEKKTGRGELERGPEMEDEQCTSKSMAFEFVVTSNSQTS